MESLSSSKQRRVLNIFLQIEKAIGQLIDWNREVNSAEDYYLSPGGMQKLAANCMLIEAIGESIHQIDKITNGELLTKRADIPWADVVGIRNHIAHGYFDIDGELVFAAIKNDLEPLREAVEFFIHSLQPTADGLPNTYE